MQAIGLMSGTSLDGVDVALIETDGEQIGAGDALEAQAVGYLAVRSLKGLPTTFPTTNGVPHPMVGGVVARAA